MTILPQTLAEAALPSLVGLDWAVIALYFVGVAGIAWWSGRKQNTSEDYFLAGRNVGWFVIGASLFASNIGSEHLVGLAGEGSDSGVAMAHYELHAWCLLVLGWVLLPFFIRSQVFTLPEFLEKRFSPASRWVVSLVSLLAYVFTKVSVTVFAGGTVVATLFPELTPFGMSPFWSGALAVVILTGIYTIVGGLRAVVYTEAAQAVVLIGGSLTLTMIGLSKLGGWGEMTHTLDPEMFNLWKPADDPNFPWPGMLFAAPIVGLWYWCTDQYIVQRTLAGRDLKTSRRGTIFGAYLKLTPVFIFIIPGMIGAALKQKGLIDFDSKDSVFPTMVGALLPAGIRGLVVAGLLAALMSSLASVFNSCSTLFTVDVYEKIKPGRPEKELVTVGRIATSVVVLAGIAWIPVMENVSDGLYKYLQSVQAYLAPPLTAIFFLGVFIRRINATGALASLIVGFVLGLTKLGCQVYAGGIKVDDAARVAAATWSTDPVIMFGEINFLMFAVYLFLASSAVMILVSLLTPAPPAEKTRGLTVGGGRTEQAERSWTKWDVIHTGIVLCIIVSVYLYFSGLFFGGGPS
ncbi:MAG: sodium/solute symporter [Phycisphaeraceae bacterium]|nr:MAG: sodium/solute symporter [Phycisphaeraceae bacterium]